MKKTSSRSRRHSGPGPGRRRKAINLKGLRAPRRAVAGALHAMKITDFYRPLKKPVTLRLDADILAWFQRGGRGYQTRINRALRQVVMAERRGRN